MTEKWLPVPIAGYEAAYFVSDTGRVKSVARVVPRGNSTMRVSERILKPGLDIHGYAYVNLSHQNKQIVRRVHQLVALAFLGNRPKGADVRHLDGDQLNNRLSNLAYGSRSDNMRDAVRHGRNQLANRTTCNYGHPLDGLVLKEGRYSRRCLTCHRLESQRRRDARKACQ